MKRSADEECPKLQSAAKKIRIDVNASTRSLSDGSSTELLAQNSLQPKDGTIEEIRVTNFMSFTSHKFRFGFVIFRFC